MWCKLSSHSTYGNFGLAERWRHVQVLRDEDMPEIVPVLDAPDGQPVDVVDRQRPGKLDLDILPLVAAQRIQRSHFVRNLDPKS